MNRLINVYLRIEDNNMIVMILIMKVRKMIERVKVVVIIVMKIVR